MPHLAHTSLVVRDYDEALAFYVGKLGFELVEDTATPEQNKRWVTIRPPGAPANATTILLARAATEHQPTRIGDQTGGRVAFFLATDDFARDHARFTAAGVEWVRPPTDQPYGRVAVWRDLYGNFWPDRVRRRSPRPLPGLVPCAGRASRRSSEKMRFVPDADIMARYDNGHTRCAAAMRHPPHRLARAQGVSAAEPRTIHPPRLGGGGAPKA